MSKQQKIISACLSIILSAALFIGVCPRFVRAVTDDLTYFTPSDEYGVIPEGNISSWWPDATKLNELPEGGWHFEWSSDGVGVRQGLTKSFPLSGLTLKFDNLENEQGKPSFAILMIDNLSQQGGNMDPVTPSAGGLALIAVDIADGEIRFENSGIGFNESGVLRYVNDGTVLLKDERLNYGNLKGKEFSISFNEAENGSYKISVDIEGQETLESTQNLTAEMLGSVTYLSNLQNVYIGLSNGRGNTGTTKLDFTSVGYIEREETDVPAESGQWFIPSSQYGFISSADISGWWGSNIELTNLPDGGGIRWRCQHNGVGMRQGWRQSFALDGLSVRLDNLDNQSGKASLLIYLSDSPSLSMDAGVDTCATDFALIALDTEDGELRFENDGATVLDGKTRIREDGTVLLSGDLLKYDSLKGKEFIITFSRGDSGYTIEVKTGDESIIGSDVLTDDMLAELTYLQKRDRVYVGIGNCNGNDGWTTVDLTGIGPIEKTEISRKELTTGNVAGQNYWETMLKYGAAPTGGLRYTFTNAFRNVRLGINETASLDGLYLKLNNITQTGSQKPSILLVLSGNQAAETADGMLGFVLDTEAGCLKVNRSRDLSGDAEYEDILLSDASLKYENITGRTVVLRAFALESGDYELSLRVGNEQPLEAVLSKEILSKSTAVSSYDNLYLTIHPAVPQNAGIDQSFSVDIVEYWSSVISVDMVIEAIDAIGDVSLENASAMRYARSLYDQLPNIDKLDVSNAEKLFDAEKRFAELAKAADSGLLLMNSGVMKLTGSSDNDIKATINGWSSAFWVDSLENGGVRFNFNGSSRNMRDGYSGTVDLNGLYIQFDRFSAGSAENAKLALMIGNGNTWGVQYSDSSLSYPLTFVLDPETGTLTAMPANETVISDEALKLENLAGERFSYEFSVRDDGGYDLTVKVAGKTLTGIISFEAVNAAVSLTASESCDFMLTAWDSGSSYTVDLIGFKQTKLTADDVMAMIDSIGLVGIDSGDKIAEAVAAYEELADSVKASVENYDSLMRLQNYYLGLDYDTMISETEELIDEIGEVGVKSSESVRAAKLAFDRLNSSQKAELSNADVLQKAIEDYERLSSDKIIYESYANAVSPRWSETPAYGDAWKDTYFSVEENNAFRINFVNAIRDVRNGPSFAMSMDGLIMRIANITPEKEGDGTGTRLSLQIGTRDNNYRGGVNLTAFALVIDTYEGTISGYPGNRVMIKDEALKQENIAGKEIMIRINMTEEELYRMEVKIDGKSLYSVIPTSLIDNSNIDLNPDSVMIALSPWVNNEDGTTDNSLHTFSVDFLSCQSTGRYAFEDLYDLMERIDRLPGRIDLLDEDDVLELSELYRELPRVMRAYVSNYGKLSAAVNQIYDLKAEDVTVWDNEKYRLPGTGEGCTVYIVLSLVAVSFAAVIVSVVLKRKSRKISK